MNKYLRNLCKIEFVVTYACTGSCKHCSEGEHENEGRYIDGRIAADAVRKVTSAYRIKTVMAFGGEPLLYPDAVYEIMTAAAEKNVLKRQVITNGYFSKDAAKINQVAKRLAECGVNDLLLSVDAFHAECIPIDTVKQFALAVKTAGVPIRTQPAWLVSKEHDNPYNRKTKELLSEFADLGIDKNEGNIVFPEGNAKVYLAEYFTDGTAENPYVEDKDDVKCISFEPNGDVLGSNIFECDIIEIIKNYNLGEQNE